MTDAVKIALIAALGGIAAEGCKVIFASIGKKMGKKDTLAEITKRLERQERDNCRIQILIMINNYPNNHTEIMKLAEHYFVTLHGDWYMTGVFNRWLMDNNIGKPEWFNSEG